MSCNLELTLMAYSDFTSLSAVISQFNLTLVQQTPEMFEQAIPISPSKLLDEILTNNMKSGIEFKSEKSKSELVISPVLMEILRIFDFTVSLFSGETFDVDKSKGLNGVCDFLISKSSIDINITQPVITVVEAKRSDLKSGMAQCVASLVAAKQFNNDDCPVYGSVTTATQWAFLSLVKDKIIIDPKVYLLPPVDKILGILATMLKQ